MYKNLIGFILIPVGVALTILLHPLIGTPFLFIGVIMFTAFSDEKTIWELCTDNGDKCEFSFIQKSYIVPLVFLGIVKIPLKTTYYIGECAMSDNLLDFDKNPIQLRKISNAQYRGFVMQQKQLLRQNKVSAEVVRQTCNQKSRASFHKTISILLIVLMIFFATMVTIGVILPTILIEVCLGYIYYNQNQKYKNCKLQADTYSKLFG